MDTKIKALKGVNDILPQEIEIWNFLENEAKDLFIFFGFNEIRIPIIEETRLFVKSIGQGTDIIEKEMYTFVTKGGDKVALRPEFTAGIARAYIQHGMNVWPKPIKFFSTGPAYRYDRPQEGRYREFYQVNYDAFGEQDPVLDAQIIQLAHRVVQSLGIKSVQIQVNSIGCPACRKEYKELLVNYLESKKQKLYWNDSTYRPKKPS